MNVVQVNSKTSQHVYELLPANNFVWVIILQVQLWQFRRLCVPTQEVPFLMYLWSGDWFGKFTTVLELRDHHNALYFFHHQGSRRWNSFEVSRDLCGGLLYRWIFWGCLGIGPSLTPFSRTKKWLVWRWKLQGDGIHMPVSFGAKVFLFVGTGGDEYHLVTMNVGGFRTDSLEIASFRLTFDFCDLLLSFRRWCDFHTKDDITNLWLGKIHGIYKIFLQ